ncbi:helix-turn-helix transcriptional regulator [Clostridiaceae bacterium M8S5]|nr:helix-turn-helix transcriptional regulator [Clostridiaceae bacterium M8S5]
MKLVTKIKYYRLLNHMSQEDLASKVGVRRETIGRLEAGKYNPSLKLAYDISEAFSVAIEDIFSYEKNDS